MRRLLTTAFLCIVLWSCDGPPPEQSFNRLVWDGDGSGISRIQSAKMQCMHCPWYSRFISTPQARRDIALAHELMELQQPPAWLLPGDPSNTDGEAADLSSGAQLASQALIHIEQQADWWVLDRNSTGLQLFMASYLPKHSTDDTAFRLMITGGGQDLLRHQRPFQRAGVHSRARATTSLPSFVAGHRGEKSESYAAYKNR